ncbi:MAG: hypothetical protein NT003_01665 [Candidatus Magasanikbacteria bacterium]|nr:hypothetical protein [Candidatus Magasanikbacteria bacterium]
MRSTNKKNTPSLATLKRQARTVRKNALLSEIKWSAEMTLYLSGQLPAGWPLNTDGSPRLPQRPRNFKGVKPYPNPIIDKFDDETPRKRVILTKPFDMPEEGWALFLDTCVEFHQEFQAAEVDVNTVEVIGAEHTFNWHRAKNISEAEKAHLVFTATGSTWLNTSASKPIVQKRDSEMLAALKPRTTISAAKVVEPVVAQANPVERKPVGCTKKTMRELLEETLQNPMRFARATC